jgi:hypothetical protein
MLRPAFGGHERTYQGGKEIMRLLNRFATYRIVFVAILIVLAYAQACN